MPFASLSCQLVLEGSKLQAEEGLLEYIVQGEARKTDG